MEKRISQTQLRAQPPLVIVSSASATLLQIEVNNYSYYKKKKTQT
jgi:hypothetical protein